MALLKSENLWDVYSLYEFQFFNCPACKYKTNSKQEFIDHAYDEHLDSNNYLKKIQDGSIRDIACPWWSSRKNRKKKTLKGGLKSEKKVQFLKSKVVLSKKLVKSSPIIFLTFW